MAVLTFGPMSYCENHRVFHRHSSYERGLFNFGYSKSDAHWMAGYRYDEVESERNPGNSTLQWAGPCEKYRDPHYARGCRTCYDTYTAFRSDAAALEAECFARAVLSREHEGDRLFMVTLKIPKVAVYDKSAYEGGRLAAYQKLSKKKRRAHKRAFEKKKRDMLSERGVLVGPEYHTPERARKRKDAHKRWLDDNHADDYQRHCLSKGILRAVVETDGKFIERESAEGGGFRYVQRGDARAMSVPGGIISWPDYRYDREFEGQAERVKPRALRWLFKQFEMRVRAIGRKRGFGIKYQAVIEQGSKGGFHYHILLHVFPTGSAAVPEDLKDVLMEEWFEVSGNVRFDEYNEKTGKIETWFTRVRDADQAAYYVAKYIGKGWFSRRQTSKFLNLRQAARDARIVRNGFLTEKITDVVDHFVRNTDKKRGDGFLCYESPLEQEDIDSAGCERWVGLEIPKQSPRSVAFPDVKIAAVFESSRPCKHPAAAKSGLCVDGNGDVIEFIPHCWWFPESRLLAYFEGRQETPQVQKLHDKIVRSKYRVVTKATAAVTQGGVSALNPESVEEQFRNLNSVYRGGPFPLQLQADRLQKSLKDLPFAIYNAFNRLGTARSALAAVEDNRKARPELPIDKASWYRLSERMRDRMRGGNRARQMSMDVTF